MFKNLIQNNQQNVIDEYESTIHNLQRKLEKYEAKLKDLVVAYRSVCDERDALSQVISSDSSSFGRTTEGLV